MAYDPQRLRQFSSQEAEALGLPKGYKLFSPYPFKGLNQQDSRFAMPDPEFFWVENLILPGSGNLRSVPGEATTAFYTAAAGKTIVFFFFYDIGEMSYCAVFLDDGTATQVNVDTLVQTTITSQAGTFYDATVSDALPSCVQWGTKYLLISSNNRQNDYWVWDSSLLYTSGTVGPEPEIIGTGAGYGSTAPTISAFGGHGTGVTATAVIDQGGVVRLEITAVGSNYQPSDVVQFRFSGGGTDDGGQITTSLVSTTVASIEITDPGYGYQSAPGVVFTGGGGASAAATATVTNGQVTAITITNAGSSYESAPVISFSGGTPTKAASAQAYLTPQGVNSVAVTQGGTGYTLPPTVAVEGIGGFPVADLITRLTGTGVSYIRVDSPGATEQSSNSTFYNSVPNVVFYPGSSGGINATATCTIRDGLLETVTVTGAGSGYTMPPRVNFEGSTSYPIPLPVTTVFLVGTSIGSVKFKSRGDGYVDAPTVLIDPGYNSAAYARVSIMPYITSGAAIETFQSRVWLAYPKEKLGQTAHTNGTLLVSSTSDVTSFPTVFVNDQSNLRARFTGIKQANGYLYTIGDSSVNVISNVQTTGDPAVTTFNFQNVDPQVGTTFRDTIQALGRSIYFANKNGVFRITGGAAQSVSDKLTNIFENAVWPDTTGITPSAAIGHIHNVRFYILLLTITDPFTDEARNVMLAYDEEDWWVLTQETDWTFINTRVTESQLHVYGTDGATITRLFNNPSATLEKVIRSKLYGEDNAGFIKLFHNIAIQGHDLSSDSSGFEAILTINTEQPGTSASVLLPATADLADTRMFVEGFGDVRAGSLGFTFGSTSKDFEILYLGIGYTLDQGPLGSSSENAPAA